MKFEAISAVEQKTKSEIEAAYRMHEETDFEWFKIFIPLFIYSNQY